MAEIKLTLKLSDSAAGESKTLTVSNADSNVTTAKLTAFTTAYNTLYETDYNLVRAVIAETSYTTIYPEA